jgi:hypothetical protein
LQPTQCVTLRRQHKRKGPLNWPGLREKLKHRKCPAIMPQSVAEVCQALSESRLAVGDSRTLPYITTTQVATQPTF